MEYPIFAFRICLLGLLFFSLCGLYSLPTLTQTVPIPSVDSPKQQADRWLAQGQQYTQVQQYTEALKALETAQAYYHKLGDRVGEARALGTIGIVYIKLNQPQQALRPMQEAISQFRQSGDRLREAAALANLGQIYRDLSQLQSAITTYQTALKIFRAVGDRPQEAQVLTALAEVYRESKQFTQAIETYTEAISYFHELDQPFERGSALNMLGDVYRQQGKVEEAIAIHQQALALVERVPALQARHALQAMTLNLLGRASVASEEFAEAINFYQQALNVYEKVDLPFFKLDTLSQLASTFQTLGQLPRALAIYEEAIVISRATRSLSHEGWLLAKLAAAQVANRQIDQALQSYAASISIREKLRVTLTVPSQQQSFVKNVAPDYQAYAILLQQQGKSAEAQRILNLIK